MMRHVGALPWTLLAVLLLLPVSALEPAAPIVEFKLGYLAIHGRRQDSATYDVDGDGKLDVFLSSIDFDKNPPERWLALHLQKDGAFPESPDRVWSLSDRASALVFGDLLPGGGIEVGFLAADGVWVYPPEKGGPGEAPFKLLHVRTFTRAPSLRQIGTWQFAADYDADGRHDLLVPLAGGYRIYFQTAPGIFGRTAELESELADGAPRAIAAQARAEKPEVVAAEFVSTTELPRLDWTDVNGDGLLDFLVIRKDAVTYFLQKEKGVFPSQRPHRVTFAVSTLRDDVKKDSVNLSMIRFLDINQDGLADLVVTKVEGTLGLWESIKTRIYLHLGTGRGNFMPDKCIVIDGVSIDPEFIDMDGDGKLDCVTSRLRTDLMKKAIEAFVLGDVQISYEVFQFDPQRNMFLTDPVYEYPIFVRRADLEKTGAGAVPLVFIRGDFTGDKRPDLLHLDPKKGALEVHPGRAKDTGRGIRIDFDGTAHASIPVDRHPKGIGIADVNGDGVNDVLLYHAGALGLVLSSVR
jgi:hypothetical protein